MLFLKRVLSIFVITGALISPITVMAETQIPWKKLHSFDNTHYLALEHQLENEAMQQYHIFIKLPSEHVGNKDIKFPTLYLLDGGVNFPLFAAYYDYLRLMEDIPPMIIVGISYGTNDWKKGNNRGHDFTAPSKKSEHYGGAKRFDTFLNSVLLPKISSLYPVDKSRNILFGQSLGGQFALYTAMYGTSPFYAVIASNPALHRNLEFFEQAIDTKLNRPKIFITSAEFDDDRFKQPLNQWHQYWQNATPDWQYDFVQIKGHNHLSATPESIRLGLKKLLN